MKKNSEYYTPNKIYTHKSILYTCKFIGYQGNKPTYEIVTTNEISGFKVGDKFTPNDPEKWFDITDTFIPPTPVKETEPDVIPEVLAEVREYTNLPIMLTDTEFPSNHLFCKRGKYCEFTELSKYVEVYVYPTYQKDKQEQTETGGFTKGEWNSDLHDGNVYSGGIVVANCYSSLLMPATIKANAELIVKAVNNFPAMVEIIKQVKFWFDNESTYPPFTGGYRIAQQAKAILTRINKD